MLESPAIFNDGNANVWNANDGIVNPDNNVDNDDIGLCPVTS